jgi:hypothetical protein
VVRYGECAGHGKWHAGEILEAECLMTLLLYGKWPHLAETILMVDKFHDDVILVHRSYVTCRDSTRMSQ